MNARRPLVPVALVLLASLAGASLAGASLAAEATPNPNDPRADWYVAPGGNDQWSGRLAQPNAQGTDGPLATLAAARDRVAQSKPTGPVRVLVHGGVYRLAEPLVFRPEHSGTKDAPITYEAYPGEKPVLSGGLLITGWQPAEGPLWRADVPGVKEGKIDFRQIFVDGRRATPAREPDDGFFRSAGPGAPYADRDQARGNEATKTSIYYTRATI